LFAAEREESPVGDSWDRVVDVVVVGSGAGALTGAIAAADGGCTVEVLEKAPLIGTSAFSGGMAWVPCNSHMAEAGVGDSREEALAGLFGPAYPGGGATLGPAITFGYLAGKQVGEEASRSIDDVQRLLHAHAAAPA
jgi:succinate dehydrogenase/fumarate reductase flavoprotein subunit